MEKSCLLLALLGFYEMCEDITSFMAGKGMFVVELANKSRSSLSFLCVVTENFHTPNI